MARYGLPDEVKFCKRCVISNQRPGSCVEYTHTAGSLKETIHFDVDGVCDACRVAEHKQKIDWSLREQELWALCDRHRSRRGYFDCVVPGSGGKDSFYAAHVLKYKYHMHPLLVTWAPHLYTDWGWRNLQRWQAIADHILYTPNREVHRLLTRLALENLLHPFQPFIIGQKNLAPKLAYEYGLNLVFYGENEAEYGNPQAGNGDPRRSAVYHSAPEKIYLSGLSVEDLKDTYRLTNADLEAYFPVQHPVPPMRKYNDGLQVHYLGYYLRWHPQECYYYAVEHGGFEAAPERTPGTYSKYNSIDDKIDDLHYHTTFIKYGIGRATYDAAQEIRSGDITREEGAALVQKFDGEYPLRFEHEVFDYLSVPGLEPMTRAYYLGLCERFKSPHLWDDGVLRHEVSHVEETYHSAA